MIFKGSPLTALWFLFAVYIEQASLQLFHKKGIYESTSWYLGYIFVFELLFLKTFVHFLVYLIWMHLLK